MKSTAQTPEIFLASAIANLHQAGFVNDLSQWLKACIPWDNFTMLAYFQDRQPTLLASQCIHPDVHKNLESIYLAGAYLIDPFHELHLKVEPRGVYRLYDVAPNQFQKNGYFNEYYRDTTMMDELVFVSYPAQGVSIHTCLGRDSTSNTRFSAKLVTIARKISPVVSSMVEAHWSDLSTSGEYSEKETTSMLIRAALDRYEISLSQRQAEVAMLVLRGHTSISIGIRLGISSQTVKVFRKQLYKKCNISSQAELFNLFLPLLSTQTTENKM